MIAASSWVRAHPRAVSVDDADESIILDPATNRSYGLAGVGHFVWGRLRSPARVADVRDALVEAYDVPPDRALHDLTSLLDDLIAAGLVEVVEGSSPHAGASP